MCTLVVVAIAAAVTLIAVVVAGAVAADDAPWWPRHERLQAPPQRVRQQQLLASFVRPTRLQPRVRQRTPLPHTRMRWLHFPKCGTAFGTTLFHYACPTAPPSAHVHCPPTHSRCSSMVLPLLHELPLQQCRAGDGTRLWAPPHVGHHPLRTGDAPFAAMFRSPKQRLLSAFYNNRHSAGFTSDERFALVKLAPRPRDFARVPGVRGCMTRMLLGHTCASHELPKPGDAHIAAAIERLHARAAFVGILERWDESVCLFYAMHKPDQRPLPVELQRERITIAPFAAHAGTGAGYDEQLLGNVVDHADECVYAAALQWFDAHVAAYNDTVAACLHAIATDGAYAGRRGADRR